MNENGSIQPERIERVEKALVQIQDRLNRIERRLGPEPPPKVTPGPAPSMARPVPPPGAGPRFEFQPAAPPSPRAKPDVDAEFRFGSVILPRVGAGVVLLGIAYLVGLGIASGWITVLHQFWGAVALCALSIGIGFWKRTEGFEFGQVLIGLGSCGLYLTFAGGFAFLELYEGEALVALFVALSMANLAYGAWSPSKTFVGIGLLGGLAASWMPLEQRNAVLSIWLHLAIVVPTAVIVARRSWPGMAMAAWTASFIGWLPVPSPHVPWVPLAAAIYGACVILLAAYAYANDNWDFDPKMVLIPAGAVMTGGMVYAIGQMLDVGSTAHLLAYGAALGLAALAFGRQPVRNAFWLGGLLAPLIFAPLGLELMAGAWTYVGLAALAAGLSLTAYPRAFFGLSLLALSLSAIRYGIALGRDWPLGVGNEAGYLAALLATIVLAAVTTRRWHRQAEIATFAATVAIAPFLARLTVLLLVQTPIQAPASVGVILAGILISGVCAGIALAKRWNSMTILSWVGLTVVAFVYAAASTISELNFELEVPLLIASAGVVLRASKAAAESGVGREASGALASIAGMPVFTRLIFVTATGPTLDLSRSAAITLGWTLYATILLMVGFTLNLRSARIFGLAVFGLTLGKILLFDLVGLTPGARVGLLILLGVAMLIFGQWYVRRGKPPAVTA